MSPISPSKERPMKTSSSSNVENNDVSKAKRGRFGEDDQEETQVPVKVHMPTYEVETDPLTLTRRRKQIEYGKNTQEYINYMTAIPKQERQAAVHPKTPNLHHKYSRRAWDGLIKVWRQNLHVWSEKGAQAAATADQDIKLGASATSSDCGDGEILNESFNSELSAETGSTSSSISAQFSGFLFTNPVDQVKVENDPDLDSTITQDAVCNDKDNDVLNTSAHSGSSGNSKLSTSWADEVEEEYYKKEEED